ncbi:MAG TPA: ABC transporter ATP-binding protein [Rectinemataceae bacterium]
MSVRLVDIRKEFPDPEREGGIMTAVADMNLEIREGEFLTLLGPSGCGKTTTLRMIAGFEIPTSGQIWIGGEMVNEVPPNKRDTTMVFQSYAIFPHMSVGQNVGFGLELKGFSKKEIEKESAAVMEVMGISELAKRRPDQLSGGQQQRVALARAIVNKPKVLLFDEPLSNLDAKLRETMRVEIRRIQQSFGITSVYVTHDQAEAMTVSDRIVVMEKGYVMQVGTPFEIYSRPSCRFVADFIGKVNFFPVIVESTGSGGRVRGPGGGLAAESFDPSLEPGDRALLVLRPESLRLEPAGARGGAGIQEPSAPEGRELLGEGEVVKAVYLGSHIEYEVEAGFEKPVLAISYDPIDGVFFKPGDSVSFSYSRKAAHILPGT